MFAQVKGACRRPEQTANFDFPWGNLYQQYQRHAVQEGQFRGYTHFIYRKFFQLVWKKQDVNNMFKNKLKCGNDIF